MEKIKDIKKLKNIIKKANKFRYVTIINSDTNKIDMKNEVRNKILLRRQDGEDCLTIKYNEGYQRYIISLGDDYIDQLRYEEFSEGLSLLVYPLLIILNARPNIDNIRKNKINNEIVYEPSLGEDSIEVYEMENSYDAIAIYRAKDYELNLVGNTSQIGSEKELLSYLSSIKNYKYVTIFKELPENRLSWHNARLTNVGIDRETSYNSIYLENDVSTEKIINKNRFDILYHDGDIEKANIIAYRTPESYNEDIWDYSILKIKNTVLIFHKYYIIESEVYKEKKQNVIEFMYDSPLYVRVENGSETIFLPDID